MKALFLLTILFAPSCAPRRAGTFQVVPQKPDYLLRSPDAQDTPFPEILSSYNGFVVGKGWVDLQPRMGLRVENAYYREGASRQGLAGFLGTEVARYELRSNGQFQEASVENRLRERPRDQPQVGELVSNAQRRYRHHKFFYAVVFKKKGNSTGSVLLSARSADELDRLAKQLVDDSDAVCGKPSSHCSVFPATSTVAVEMGISVNGTRRTVPWGTLLGNIASEAKSLAMLRIFQGRLTPVRIDFSDRSVRRLPLLPGDQIIWN